MYFELFRIWTRNRRKVHGTHTNKPEGLWNRCADMIHRRESGHPIFRATCALDRGSLKSRGGGKLSIHYNGDSTTAELLFRIVISVNLSVYGAISDWSGELVQQNLRSFVFQHGKNPWRKRMTSRSLESHPTSCQSLRSHLRSAFQYRGTCCGGHSSE